MAPPSYHFDAKSLRYRDQNTGRYIARNAVRASIDRFIADEANKARRISQDFVDGKINLAEWQIQMTTRLKDLHVALGLAASGGRHNATPSDIGYIAGLVKAQYKFFRDFAKAVKNGSQPRDGTLVARSALYFEAARGTYEETTRRKAREAGLREERRNLGPADHCQTCVEQARRGFQPIGSLRKIGDSPCRSRCHCTFAFR